MSYAPRPNHKSTDIQVGSDVIVVSGTAGGTFVHIHEVTGETKRLWKVGHMSFYKDTLESKQKSASPFHDTKYMADTRHPLASQALNK